MNASRNVLLAIAASAALATTVPAFAQNWNHGYGHRHYRGGGPLYYGPPRVVYAPAPAFYYGPQVVYAQPRWRRAYRR